MRTSSRTVLALLASVTTIVLVIGCAPASDPTPAPQPAPAPQPIPAPGSAPTSPPSAAVPRPGLETLPGGSTAARGWIVRSDIEGGFWALSDAEPGATTGSTILVVLLPGKVVESVLATLEAKYVYVTGPLAQGASIRMAGPEMTVDSIEPLPVGQ
jgi:hypothetical protein